MVRAAVEIHLDRFGPGPVGRDTHGRRQAYVSVLADGRVRGRLDALGYFIRRRFRRGTRNGWPREHRPIWTSAELHATREGNILAVCVRRSAEVAASPSFQ
jgi:hypothetical protein